ncbi:NUMOD3 domain-containing DNA-binding protein [Bradyrhizobium elkanii]|uniref:NUMOD3 domain-containing DNA-binding protein n=1 Tax=Bradyrhizobium elkanii TaxID=29448 RepID=UPI003D1C2A8E
MVSRGSKMSEESRAKMRAAAKRRPSNRLGKKHTLETRQKISERTRERAVRGKDAPGYIDGLGVERRGLRHTSELKRWRYDVYRRDGFACAHCGDDTGGNLNAHHIRPFADHPDLRFDVRNGITLCVGCHALAHQTDLWGYPQPAA